MISAWLCRFNYHDYAIKQYFIYQFTNIFLITESLRLCPATQATLDGIGPTKPRGCGMSFIDMEKWQMEKVYFDKEKSGKIQGISSLNFCGYPAYISLMKHDLR